MNHWQRMNNLGPYFCTAPWTHTYVSPQGERRLCCASREEASFQKQYIDAGEDNDSKFNPNTLDEHWNSEYMKNIRKDILAGKKIPQCDVCNNQVLNLHTYKQYFTETLFPHKIQDIIDNTDETGHTTLQPVSYDYRISNLCNFKCRMCGEQLSSSWETEKREHKLLNYEVDKWLQPDVRKRITTFQKEVLEEELQRAVDNKTIEEIYWVGGEPLMWERHWTIMQQLVHTGQAKDITIRYNTNLSRVVYKNYSFYPLLSQFKNINVCASIDGVGVVGEYIRTGLDYELWLDNFKRGLFLINHYGDDAMVFDVTITTPGLYDLHNLIDTVLELDVKSYVKITFAFDPSVLMNPLCLPRHVLEPLVHKKLEYIESRLTPKIQVYKDTLLNILERPTFEEQYPNDYISGRRRGKDYIEFMERVREQPITYRDILCHDGKQWWDTI